MSLFFYLFTFAINLCAVMRLIAGDTYVFQQDSAHDTVQLLQQETPEFIAPNSLDLNPVDYLYSRLVN